MKVTIHILTALFLLSCEKINPLDGCRNPKGKGEVQIEIGDREGMVVNVYDELLKGDRIEEQSMVIDFDNDCIEDVRLISRVWGSAGLGSHGEPKIVILNEDVSILVESFEDTTYYQFDSTFYQDDENIIITTNERYLCSEKTDSIYEINSSIDRVSPLENGEILHSARDFSSSDIVLANDNVGFNSSWGFRQDTAYYNYVFSENDCDDFPSSVVRHIGVMISGSRKRKLGWIKLALFNGSEILLLESAIEE